MNIKDKIVIVDGNNLAFRNFYAMKSLFTSTGLRSGMFFGFLKSILTLIRKDYRDILITWDTGAKSFRHILYPEYKKSRIRNSDFDYASFIDQKDQLIKFLSFVGFKQFSSELFEADDVIASLAISISKSKLFKNLVFDSDSVVIYSADHDFFQLVNDKIFLMRNEKGKDVIYGVPQVIKKVGVPPNKCVLFYSLVGDSSDNISGLRGIGPKRALEILSDVDTFDDLMASTNKYSSKVLSNQSIIQRNIKLMDLSDRDLIADKINLINLGGIYENNARSLLVKYETAEILQNLPAFIAYSTK